MASDMICVISDFNHVVGVVVISSDFDLEALKEEFDRVAEPEPNPYKYDTPIQAAWLERHHANQDKLVEMYGGDPCGPYDDNDRPARFVFAASTFVGWLVKEKGARCLDYREICLAEFD
jgi:hypothetical protein